VSEHFRYLANVSALALVAFVGFAGQRASLCTVRAVAEVLGTRRAYLLASFGKASLWAAMVYGTILMLTTPATLSGFQTYAPWTLVLAGAFVFGAGAAITGGCSMSLLQRLADGDLGMAFAFLGLLAGVLAWSVVDASFAMSRTVRIPVIWHDLGGAAAVVLMALWILAAFEVRRLWGSRSRLRFWQLPGAAAYRLSTAAIIVGLSAGLLNALLGSWTYTYYLRYSIGNAYRGERASVGFGLWVLAAFVTGMVVSAIQRRSFRLRWGTVGDRLQRLAGGTLMGVGGAMIPGGNDTLLLTGIPTLSGLALATYGALLLGIAITLVLMRQARWAIPVVDCTGDICRSRP